MTGHQGEAPRSRGRRWFLGGLASGGLVGSLATWLTLRPPWRPSADAVQPVLDAPVPVEIDW